MAGHRRVVQTVTLQDSAREGRPSLYAYGRRWLAEMAGVSEVTLRRAIREGLDVGDPVVAVAWILRHRGETDLADQLISVLSDKRE